MANITINTKDRTIDLTKAFATKAHRYGTDEYTQLQGARRDYPNYKVVVRSSEKNKDGFKGLTVEYMEMYIKKNPKEIKETDAETGNEVTKNILVEFYILCGKDEKGAKTEFSKAASYGKIKKWFLEMYPVFEEYRQANLKKRA